MTSLDNLKPGEKAIVKRFAPACALQKRLMDLGMIEGTQVGCLHKARSGDPAAYDIRGAVIALRRRDARFVEVSRVSGGECR